jgi:hypothetical protein
LPDQQCPRCGNTFPGGLHRCTACGLDITKAKKRPESALPWQGYEQGVIICKNCNFANPDDLARRGKIQKCDQCARIIYIPSGLYSRHNPGATLQPRRKPMPKPVFVVSDVIGAVLTKLYRSKYKWLVLLFITIGAIGLLAGLFFVKNAPPPEVKVDPPIKVYYNSVFPVRTDVAQSLDNFKNEAGGIPLQKDYNYWLTPANKDRFVRACDRTLKTIEGAITQLAVLQEKGLIPPEAQNYQMKFMASLVDRQRFYARLKDGINNKSQISWDSAFSLKDPMAESTSDEMSALENLRDLALKSTNGKK